MCVHASVCVYVAKYTLMRHYCQKETCGIINLDTGKYDQVFATPIN